MKQTTAPEKNRLLLSVLPALILPTLCCLIYFVLLFGTTAGTIVYIGTKVFTLLWPLLAILLILKRPLRPELRKANWKKHLRAIPLGIATGLAITAAGLIAIQTPFGDIVRAHSDDIRGMIEKFGIANHFWLFAAWISILHSALEEYYWRWFAFGRLAELAKPWLAHALAALAFASHHVVNMSQCFPLWFAFILGACVALGGLIWTWQYQKQNSLVGVWISHLIVDYALLTIAWKTIHS